MPNLSIKFRRIGKHNLPLPAYHTPGAAGMDLRAAFDTSIPSILSGARRTIPTGFAVEIPDGFEGQVRPRSGLSRDGIDVCLGTIDSDYRGELMVTLYTKGVGAEIKRGDRIAQLVVAPVVRALPVEVKRLAKTPRGAKGFGSTGAR